ncbi:MAG: FHA domain-containing protein [Acidobacteriota bacterium]
MICPNCGTQNRDDAKFCKSCGTPLKPPVPGSASALTTLAGTPSVETNSPMVIGLEAIFISGLRKGESVRLMTFPATVGRDPNSTLPLALQDQLASTRHAQILCEGGSYLLRDVGSSNGTYRNGQRITEIRLQDQDVIEFGVGGPKVRFNFIRQPETQRPPVDRFEAATLPPTPAMATGSREVTFSSKPTVSNDNQASQVPAPPSTQAETVFGASLPDKNKPALPPPPPSPPPLPAFESAATVAQAAQNQPLETAPPPYHPPADYASPVGNAPPEIPFPPATTGSKSNLILIIIAIGSGVLIVLLLVAAVLAYVFLFQ